MSIPRSNELIKRSGDKIKIAGRVDLLAALRREGVNLDTLAQVHAELINPPEDADPSLDSVRLRAVALIIKDVLGIKKVAGDKITPDEDAAILEEMTKNWKDKKADLSLLYPHREDLRREDEEDS